MGSGLVVDEFCNNNPYSAVSTAGVRIHLKRYPFNLKAFMTDVSSFTMGGALLLVEPGPYRFGAGYYFDIRQREPFAAEKVQRYIGQPALALHSDSTSTDAGVQFYELDAGFDFINVYQVRLHFLLEFAQKIKSTGLDGFVLKGPGLIFEWKRIMAGAGYSMEASRMISGQFHSFYMTNRKRVLNGDTILTQNDVLSQSRRINGLYFDFGVSPVRGTSFKFSWHQDILAHNVFTDTAANSTARNYKLDLSFAIDSSLTPALAFAEIYGRQVQGGYFPSEPKLFSSWGFETGLNLLTNPVLAGFSLETGIKMFYLDLDYSKEPAERFNGIIDETDMLFEAYMGIRRGIL
jgi:hypothetical protein